MEGKEEVKKSCVSHFSVFSLSHLLFSSHPPLLPLLTVTTDLLLHITELSHNYYSTIVHVMGCFWDIWSHDTHVHLGTHASTLRTHHMTLTDITWHTYQSHDTYRHHMTHTNTHTHIPGWTWSVTSDALVSGYARYQPVGKKTHPQRDDRYTPSRRDHKYSRTCLAHENTLNTVKPWECLIRQVAALDMLYRPLDKNYGEKGGSLWLGNSRVFACSKSVELLPHPARPFTYSAPNAHHT